MHHARKNGSAGQPGQSLRGSCDFFAWADSLLYVRRHRGQLVLTAEHRGAPAPEPISLALVGEDDVHLEVASADADAAPSNGEVRDAAGLDQAIVDALALSSVPVARAELRARLRVRNERIGEALTRLVDQGAVLRDGERYAIPDSPHP